MPQPDLTAKRMLLRRPWTVASVAIIAVVLLVTIGVVKPAMPDRILVLTGSESSAYHELGMRYAEDLRRRGLKAEVIVTESVLDNVRQVGSSKNAVAFAPATIDWKNAVGIDSSHLVALASVGFKPLWLFYRSDLDISRISDLAHNHVVTEVRARRASTPRFTVRS